MKKGFLLAIASLTLVACSNGNKGGGSSNAVPNIFTQVANAIGNALPKSTSANSLSMANAYGDDIGMFANTDFGLSGWPNLGGGFDKSGAAFLADLVSEQFQNSVRSRFKNGLMIACLLDLYAVKGSDGKLALGNNQFTVTAAWQQSGCPGASTMNIPPNALGQTLNFTVTDISNSPGTAYDRKIDMPPGGPFQHQQYLYLKVANGGVVTFAHDTRFPGNERAINFVYYNPNTQLVRAQFVTNVANNETIYRLYSSGGSDKFALVAYNNFPGSDYTQVVLTGKASNLNKVTAAAMYTLASVNNANDASAQGCMDYQANSIDPNGFNNCVSGVTGLDENNIINNSTIHASNDVADNFNPNFTDSDIKTAPTGMPQ